MRHISTVTRQKQQSEKQQQQHHIKTATATMMPFSEQG